MDKKNINDIDAIDALVKIRAILVAAGLLTANSDETALMYELLSAAEDVATRVLEGISND